MYKMYIRFNYSRLCLALLVFFMLGTPAQAQQPDSTLSLQALIDRALEQNPSLHASQKQWEARQHRVPQAGTLPDPQLGLNLMNLPVNSFSFDQEPMTGKQVTLMQMFPFPGKLDLRRDIAESMAAVAEQRYREQQNQLVKQVKLAYYELYYIDRALETVNKNIDLLQQFTSIAETRYSVGKGLQQDVLRAQVKLSRMMDRRITLQQKREVQEARINELVNNPPETPLGRPVAARKVDKLPGLDSLRLAAKEHSPLLAAWQQMVTTNDHKVNLALKDRYPDFSLGLAYTQREQFQNGNPGYDFLSAMFSVSIPIHYGRKQAEKVQETKLQRSSVGRKFDEVQNRVDRMLREKLTEAHKNQRLVELYRTGVLPQAEQSLESSLEGYRNDQVDFLSLLDSEMSLFNFRLDFYRFEADLMKNRAELQALTGNRNAL